MSELKTIKTIAGEVLLYFYWLQRRDLAKLSDAILSFQLRHFPKESGQVGPVLQRRTESILSIEELKKYTDADLFNALAYLNDHGLIEYNASPTNTDTSFINLRVTSSGIDIIEGIERGQDERSQFNVVFNFNLTNNVTVESLLKAELGSLVKASLL